MIHEERPELILSSFFLELERPSLFVEIPDVGYQNKCGGSTYGWRTDWSIEIDGDVPVGNLPQGVLPWKDLIYKYASKHDIPAHYVAGIMSLESGGKQDAGSPAGAMGLMQLIHSTANNMAGRKLTVDEIYDPDTNLDLACKLLRSLWDKYQGDPIKIAFAYNAGSARCGSGCIRDYADKEGGMPCIQSCTPNRFNLVGDCYKGNATTVDYGGKVAGFANAALITHGFDPQGTQEAPAGEGSSSSSSSAGWLVLLAGAAALGFVANQKYHFV